MRRVVLFVAILAVVRPASPLSACQCSSDHFRGEATRARLVVIGTMRNRDVRRFPDGAWSMTVEVSRVAKGKTSARYLQFGDLGEACGYPPDFFPTFIGRGRELVFAVTAEPDRKVGYLLDWCPRNWALVKSRVEPQEDLSPLSEAFTDEELRELVRPPASQHGGR